MSNQHKFNWLILILLVLCVGWLVVVNMAKSSANTITVSNVVLPKKPLEYREYCNRDGLEWQVACNQL